MPRISPDGKVVIATGGTLLIFMTMLAGFAASDRRDIRTELRAEAARLDARMLTLETGMAEGFRAVDARLVSLEERFESRFARMEERLDRVIELLGERRTAAAPAAMPVAMSPSPIVPSPASVPPDAPPPVMTSVTPVPGTDFVILASEPRAVGSGWIGWTAGSGN